MFHLTTEISQIPGKLMYNLDYLNNLSTDQFARDYVTRVFGVMTDMVDRLPQTTN